LKKSREAARYIKINEEYLVFFNTVGGYKVDGPNNIFYVASILVNTH
jgi:hypothetical protein